MSQIYLLTGENTFELSAEKDRWVRGFIDKHGNENLSRIRSKNFDFSGFLDEVAAAPFIAPKRLIVLDGIPKMDKEQFGIVLQTLHPDLLLLIVDPKPDKRLSVTKELLSVAEVKTFNPIRGPKLISWVQKLATQHGSRITPDTAQYLIQSVGEDQMLLASEVEKFATCTLGQEITRATVDDLVVLSAERVSWRLLDLIGEGDFRGALSFTQQMLAHGENPHALWNQLLWIVSQIVLVSGAVMEGEGNPNSIAKTTGVPPLTARALLPLARKIDKRKLERIAEEFSSLDKEMKTGGNKATAEAPEELLSILDTSIAMVSKL